MDQGSKSLERDRIEQVLRVVEKCTGKRFDPSKIDLVERGEERGRFAALFFNEAGKALSGTGVHQMWLSKVYIVQVRTFTDPKWGEIDHLMIQRQNGRIMGEWYEFQRIKDEVLGPERKAVQIFPAMSKVVDGANIYHLFSPRQVDVVPDFSDQIS